MFVRRKKNRSGTTSVVVVDKHGGKLKELHTIGVSCDETEIERLCLEGRQWIKSHLGIRELDFESPESKDRERETAEEMLSNVDSILLNGAKLILDKVYDSVGFNQVGDEILRHLVVARLCQPMSKMATVEYLKSHFDEDVDLNKIYRYPDKLYNTQKDIVQRVSVEHTFKVLRFMIKRNIGLLRSGNYSFIVGARIKKYAGDVKKWILSLSHEDGRFYERALDNGDRLIVTYSSNRASKDAYNRSKGVERLKKAYASGKITKDKINKRGYSKFLKIENDVDVSINENKIREDEQWDGLKGYVTNTDLQPGEVVVQYKGLWVVERAFRISKGTIETRPIFHFTERRIEAHVCLCFVAYKIYKELERIIYNLGLDMSVDTVLKNAKTITTIRLRLPLNGSMLIRTMLLTPEQKSLKPLFDHFGV